MSLRYLPRDIKLYLTRVNKGETPRFPVLVYTNPIKNDSEETKTMSEVVEEKKKKKKQSKTKFTDGKDP